MKHACAFFTFFLIIASLFSQSFEVLNEHELPFVENWDEGSFEFNGWHISEDSAWAINNDVGNPEPSAQLNAELLEGGQNYYCSLISSLISGVDFLVGEIFFDFNVKLVSIQPSNGERLYVDISYDNGLSWHNLKVFHGDDDYNFENGFRHINISRYAIGKSFQLRFEASGSDPNRISAWFVDNIQIYRTCKAPENLEGNDFWSNNTSGIEIKWEAPKVPDDNHVLVSWDKMEYAGGFGIDQGGTFSVAQRWDAGQLKNWNGMDFTDVPIKKIVFGLNDDGFDQMTLKIWSGPNAANLLYEKIVTYPLIGDFVEVILDSLVFFDVDKELWVGYTLTNQPINWFPAMHDVGPAVPGYGDLFTTDGLNWYNFSDYGYDNNLIIWTLFESSYSYAYQNGFNLYRMEEGVDIDYIYYDHIESVANQNQYVYQDLSPNLTVGNTYKYRLTTDWKSETDSCESTFAMNPEETEDYVSVMITGMDNNLIDKIILYPNPATDWLNISSGVLLKSIAVFNTVGQIVFEENCRLVKNFSVNTESFQPGIFLVKIKTHNSIITQKVVVNK